MKTLLILTASAAALGALALPAAAGCAGHDVTAEAKSEPIVTAERGPASAPRSETPVVKPADEADDARG